MTLKEWIEASNLSYEEVSRLIPCSATYPWMLAHGKARPGWKMAKRIEAVTFGAVPTTNWFNSDSEASDGSEEYEDVKSISDIMKEVNK